MWTCPQCDYVNEDLDGVCARCSAERPLAADATRAAAAGPAPDTTVVQPAAVPEESPSVKPAAAVKAAALDPVEAAFEADRRRRGRKSRADIVAALVIVLCVAGLAAVGIIAWQRGYLDRFFGADEAADGAPVTVVNVDPNAPADGDLTALEDPLLALQDDVAGIKPYRRYEDVLRRTDAALQGFAVQTTEAGVLAEATKQQLYELEPVGAELVREYDDFEDRAVRDKGPKLQPYIELVRGEFVRRMDLFLTTIGKAYAAEPNVNHPVFTLSDTFIAALDRHGRADATPLRDRWLEAIHAQEQTQLDETYSAEIAALTQHVEKLKQTHLETDELLQAAPEYRVRGGMLNETARNLLDVYDGLAGRVEAAVTEFEAYTATLPRDHRSDRIDALIEEFNTLAQQDHLYAFQETYSIYEKDRELNHPAYQNLKVHYEWAKQHWPERAAAYEKIFHEAETKWADRWAQ